MKSNGSGRSVSCIKPRRCAWSRVHYQQHRRSKPGWRSARINASRMIAGYMSTDIPGRKSFASHMQGRLAEQTQTEVEESAKARAALGSTGAVLSEALD